MFAEFRGGTGLPPPPWIRPWREPHVQLDIHKHFFSVRIVDAWNSLPAAFLRCNNVVNFKRKLDCLFKVVEKGNLHYCKEHILDYNVSPFLFLASNICNFCKHVIFLEISDGCKFCTIKDRNFKFSGDAQLLVCCSAWRKEHLSVHYGWSGNTMKMSKTYSLLCKPLILAFCFSCISCQQ